MNFDDLLRKSPKTDAEFVLILLMMRVSTLPEYSRFTCPEIYEKFISVAKLTAEYQDQKAENAS